MYIFIYIYIYIQARIHTHINIYIYTVKSGHMFSVLKYYMFLSHFCYMLKTTCTNIKRFDAEFKTCF